MSKSRRGFYVLATAVAAAFSVIVMVIVMLMLGARARAAQTITGTTINATTTNATNISILGSGTLTIPSGATISNSGAYSGSVSAANLSSGSFGANTGGGNYTFPGTVTATQFNVSGGSQFMAGSVAHNMKLKGGGTTAVGISGYDSNDTWYFQLYGDGNGYGFLNGNWAGWDLKKTVGGALVLNGSQTVLHTGNYNSYAPTLTGSGASGTWGIGITGSAGSLGGLTKAQLWNNNGNNHSTYQDFNSIPDFGVWFMQNSNASTNNGPGQSTQYYTWSQGLGNEYPYSQYAMQAAIARTPVAGVPYFSVRFKEGGSWQSWQKIYAGYADTAGTASNITAYTINQNLGTGNVPTFAGVIAAANGYYQLNAYNNTGYFAMNNASTYWGIMGNYGVNDWRIGWGSPTVYTGWSLRWDASGNAWANSSFTSGGLINAGNYLQVNSKYAIDGTDAWLRLNQQNSFTNGVYTPYNLRVDGGYYGGGTVNLRENTVVTGTLQATIFYDSNDTAYYIDPASTSNFSAVTALTRARAFNQSYNTFNRNTYTSDTDYWTGTNGWATSHTWDTAWKLGAGGVDLWGTGTDHPEGAGYIHAQGIISGLHYNGGTSGYGWMIVGSQNGAADGRWWLRGKWGATTYAWKEMITSGNIASQSVSSATNFNNGTSYSSGANVYAGILYDANNTGYYVDPNGNSRMAYAYIGTGDNLWLVNWPGYGGLVGYQTAYLYPGYLSGQGTGWNQSYYLAGSTSWGLYSNTSLNAQGLYDAGNRVCSTAACSISVTSHFYGTSYFGASDQAYITPSNGYVYAPYFYGTGAGGYLSSINGSFTANRVPRADGAYRLTNGSIYDDGIGYIETLGEFYPGNTSRTAFQGSYYIGGNQSGYNMYTNGNFGTGGCIYPQGYGICATSTAYGSLRLITTAAGYYGILMGDAGTASPNFMFDTSGNGGIYYQNWGWSMYYLVSTRHWNINTSTDLGYSLGVSGSLYTSGVAYLGGGTMYVNTNGNVGIGDTNPSWKLTVNGNIHAGGTIEGTVFYDTSDYTYYVDPAGSTSANFWGTAYSRYDFCNTVIPKCLSSASDQRLKTNITSMRSVLNSVMQLRPITYQWNDDYYTLYPQFDGKDRKQRIGFVAQEVEPLFPQTVAKGHDGYYFVDYEEFVPVLTSAVQELKTEKDKDVETLQNKLNVQQKQIEELKTEVKLLKSKAKVR